ncbi:hypothetical protein MAE02_05590 [Microvirga aerophila]|uniref:Uncharacterized protein n=1 Tax=Microvirga aerophila TaxID=670291 RepID=A0A512BLN9_9HYPH|nr:hypothetical protein MAE02_05590 [Microvirga aerophila]
MAEQVIQSALADRVADELAGSGDHLDQQAQLCRHGLFLVLLFDKKLCQGLSLHRNPMVGRAVKWAPTRSSASGQYVSDQPPDQDGVSVSYGACSREYGLGFELVMDYPGRG